MPFKIYTRFDDDDEWTAVIDMKRSRSKLIERIFLNKQEAEHFVKNSMRGQSDEQVKIVEMDVQ